MYISTASRFWITTLAASTIGIIKVNTKTKKNISSTKTSNTKK